MKIIILSKGKGHTLVDDEDYEAVNKFGCRLDSLGYAILRKKGTCRLHRFIMKPAKGMVIDHINGNKLDNRRSNLRVCTPAENNWNQKKCCTNTSGYKGVALMHGKYWRAYITIKDRQKHLGIFKTKETAAKAYDEAAKLYRGEFAKLNFD